MMGVPAKPKGMHRGTYRRIATQAECLLSRLMPKWTEIQTQAREHLIAQTVDGQNFPESLDCGWLEEPIDVEWLVSEEAIFEVLLETTSDIGDKDKVACSQPFSGPFRLR